MNFFEFNAHANKYANLFLKMRSKKDDVVSLYLENGIEFLSCWLGLSKIGVITAWLNSNLKLEPLAHSIRVSKCKTVLTSRTLYPAIANALSTGLLDSTLRIFLVDGPTNGMTAINDQLNDATEPDVSEEVNFQSILCYIYTSGTTGAPKAAIIKHFRYYLMAFAGGTCFGIRSSERIYIHMPLYHSAAGILGAGQMFIRGSTLCIRTKFSVNNFWKDCVRYGCTMSQYIGELCRYLLTQKPCEEEKQHKLRMMIGNGLRPEIWEQFVERFKIQKIGEFYGSTEGNSNLLNIDNKIGSCGFIPIYPFLHLIYPIRLLKVDPETGELVRNSNGFYQPCRPGESGEVVAVIPKNDLILRFEGYTNKEETHKKILHNATFPGDTVFTSGDILHWDKLGYMQFKDRRGDTYRWRGENVSTVEVEGVMQPIQSLVDVVVYGVEIPGREGRAGMMAITIKNGTNIQLVLDAISQRLRENLASYAIPVFLRVCHTVDKTSTFKLVKLRLQKEAYNLEHCAGDQIFFWNDRCYFPLTPQMKTDIDTGIYAKI